MMYDGFDYRSLAPFLVIEDINRPMVSEISTQTEKYAGMDGSVYGSSKLEEKIIEVTIRQVRPFEELGLNAGFEKARRLLGKGLYKREPCVLWLHDAPDLYDMAVLSGKTDIEKQVYSRVTLLTFVCPSPLSWSKTLTETSTGGKVNCLVDGTDKTQPLVVVDAQGPFIVKFDDEEFEVTQSVTGDVFIDSRLRSEEDSGHRVFTEDMQTVKYSIYNNWPEWDPGIHTVECSRPFSVSWRERWR